ncbi:MAG: DUF4363 family protein [Clostridia bacterium]|nr:DUF4363 family protein [Clostridia bacterium]
MVKTAVSIIISLAFIVGVCAYELYFVNTSFAEFRKILCSLYEKAENSVATHEDGIAAQRYWQEKKSGLHVWLPHTAIDSVDFQLSEALGYLYEGRYTDALPKIEVLIDMSENIPNAFKLLPENIF